MKIILIGCGKAKRDEPSRAEDLYTGNLFRARRAYAEASGCPWGIVSAPHSFLAKGCITKPYDFTWPNSSTDLRSWGFRVLGGAGSLANGMIGDDGYRIGTRHDWPKSVPPFELEYHAGRSYFEPIEACLAEEARGITLALPLRGMGIGRQLGWYKKQRQGDLFAM